MPASLACVTSSALPSTPVRRALPLLYHGWESFGRRRRGGGRTAVHSWIRVPFRCCATTCCAGCQIRSVSALAAGANSRQTHWTGRCWRFHNALSIYSDCFWSVLRRNAVGVSPYIFRNAEERCCELENPQLCATMVTESSDCDRCVRASSSRRSSTYHRGDRPVIYRQLSLVLAPIVGLTQSATLLRVNTRMQDLQPGLVHGCPISRSPTRSCG